MTRRVTRGREAPGMTIDASAQPPDQAPELQQAALQIRTVFEATTDGMLVVGAGPGRRHDTIVDVNHALSAMTGFRPDELIGANPLRLVHPADRRRVAAAGAAIRTQERFTATVTAVRLEAFRLLEQRVAERTHELETLLAVAQSVASTLELPALLALVLDQLKAVVDHDGAAIMLHEGDEIRIVEARDYRTDVPHADAEMAGLRFPADRAGRIWEALSRRESVIIGDVRGEEPLAAEYRPRSARR
jgi:PAS domain S-box-containing protein